MDADQRLLPGVFEHVMQFFDDPRVAFVQVPQYYSGGLDTAIALSAWIQQIPFLRVIMRGGRHMRNSAFSLGSSTIYRVRHLLSIGGLYEGSVTEDIYTSVMLHERGFRSVYVDLPFVWGGGEAPKDLPSYMTQQSRWALGTFQLIGKLLNARLGVSQLLDYINGAYYWFFVSILTIAGILAPSIFLMFRVFFLSINPILYLVTYIPVFLLSLMFYLAIMGRYGYGLREFMYHQGIQFVVSLPVTIAFIWWVLRRKGFRVTPKGVGASHFTIYHTYYLAIIAFLTAAIVIGMFNAIHTSGALFYAYVINLFWAGWWLVMALLGFYISLALPPAPENAVMRVSQSYDGLEHHALQLLTCGIQLERVIAAHYFRLAEVHREYSEVLRRIAEDSVRHAEIYSRLLGSLRRLRGGLHVEGGCIVGGLGPM
ncbi:glycosyltransferase family 2 protein [Vulcanisaeta distributa]|uniref:glycosyltransferase family 2 protein n=1 Tax=Vulcanisaeta distributa TaxID=164451 RepID=UPI001FB3634E|nr:glycosyltransferase family 2 protein [Vulcanisaeta distributa]